MLAILKTVASSLPDRQNKLLQNTTEFPTAIFTIRKFLNGEFSGLRDLKFGHIDEILGYFCVVLSEMGP